MKYFKKCLFILIVLILNVMVINYIFSTTPEPEVNRTKASTSFLGDVNTDGMIDILDALLVARFYVGFQVNLFDSEAADVNCDGIVDIIDALILARYYVGLITEFPCPAETPTITPTPTPTPTQVPTLIQMIDTKHNEYILKGDLYIENISMEW